MSEHAQSSSDLPRATRSASALTTWGVRIAGALTVLMGAVFLVLWLAGIGNELSSRNIIIPKTNLALAFLLSGTSLLLLERDGVGKVARQIALVLAAVTMLLGALTLSEHLFEWNLGIDQLLATEVPGVARTASPNRMGPPASLSMTLLGLGLLAVAGDGARSRPIWVWPPA